MIVSYHLPSPTYPTVLTPTQGQIFYKKQRHPLKSSFSSTVGYRLLLLFFSVFYKCIMDENEILQKMLQQVDNLERKVDDLSVENESLKAKLVKANQGQTTSRPLISNPDRSVANLSHRQNPGPHHEYLPLHQDDLDPGLDVDHQNCTTILTIHQSQAIALLLQL